MAPPLKMPAKTHVGVVATSTRKSAETNTLRQRPRLVACYRFGDIHFAFNRSFVRDTREAIRILHLVQRGFETFPPGQLAIFGHADYVGLETDNKTLSERRAEAVYGLLSLQEAVWKRLYDVEKWDEDQSIAAVLPSDPSAIRAYLEGLLKKAGLKPVPAANFCPIWPASAPVHPFMGCSEFNPHRVFNADQVAAHRLNHELRNRENAPNRRVVLFLFDPKRAPRFPCQHSSKTTAAEAIKQCDIPLNWSQNRVYKRHVTPTFACKFYDSQIARFCKVELSVPRLVSHPCAVILIKGYEVGLRRSKYCAYSMRDDLNRVGGVEYDGLLTAFKLWCSKHYLAFRDEALKTKYTDFVRQAKNKREQAAALREKLNTTVEPELREGINHDIEQLEDVAGERERITAGRPFDQATAEYKRRITGSLMLDMWIVETLSRNHPITSSVQAEAAPPQPLPFKPADWRQATLIERQGGEGFVRSLLELRARELTQWVAAQAWTPNAGNAPPYWEYWSTEQGQAEVEALLGDRSIPLEAPNGNGLLRRATSALAVAGFGEQQSQLDPAAKDALVRWLTTCVQDEEMPYPPDHIGLIRPHHDDQGKLLETRIIRYRDLCKEERKRNAGLQWRVFIFPAPSIKEWQAGQAGKLSGQRAECLREVCQNHPTLKGKLVGGWGGEAGSPWVPEAVDCEQVWKLAQSVAAP